MRDYHLGGGGGVSRDQEDSVDCLIKTTLYKIDRGPKQMLKSLLGTKKSKSPSKLCCIEVTMKLRN